MKEDFYKYASGQMTAPELRKKYPNKISDIDLKSIESAYAKSNHEPVTGALPEEEKQSPSEYVNDYLGMGYKAGYEQSKKNLLPRTNISYQDSNTGEEKQTNFSVH